jgi:hypothetical protein
MRAENQTVSGNSADSPVIGNTDFREGFSTQEETDGLKTPERRSLSRSGWVETGPPSRELMAASAAS